MPLRSTHSPPDWPSSRGPLFFGSSAICVDDDHVPCHVIVAVDRGRAGAMEANRSGGVRRCGGGSRCPSGAGALRRCLRGGRNRRGSRRNAYSSRCTRPRCTREAAGVVPSPRGNGAGRTARPPRSAWAGGIEFVPRQDPGKPFPGDRRLLNSRRRPDSVKRGHYIVGRSARRNRCLDEAGRVRKSTLRDGGGAR